MKKTSLRAVIFAIIKKVRKESGEVITVKRLTGKFSAARLRRPQLSGEQFRDRLKRGFILFIVGVFLVGGVGIYILIFFTGDNQEVGADLQKQLAEQQALQELKNKEEKPVEQSFIVGQPITELQVVDITPGTGAEATADSTVKVNYKGGLASNGQIFDQSSAPIELSLNQVIAGWKEGIPGMKVGGKRKLLIPAAKGYGQSGTPDGSIPPNSDLVFEVELVEVK